MTISIIVPFYNVEAYIAECLDSLVNQTYRDIEIILINDGSTDNSLVIANKFKALDRRIIIISQDNKGQSAARNIGIEHATGEYIVFIDSDDYLDHDCLKECHPLMTQNNLDIIFFDAKQIHEYEFAESDNNKRRRIFDTNIKSGDKFLEEEIKKNVINYSPVMLMLKRDLLIKNNLSFYEGIIHEDILFHYHILLNAKRVCYLPKTLYIRRIRENSTVTTKQGLRNAIGYKVTFMVLWKEIKPNQKNNKIFYYECARRFIFILRIILKGPEKNERKKIRNELFEVITLLKGRRLLFLFYVLKTFIYITFSRS